MAKKDAPSFDMSRMESDERILKRGFWQKMRRTVGMVPFSEEAVAAFAERCERLRRKWEGRERRRLTA